MTEYRQISRYIFVVVAILLVIGLEVTTARGGRGGGFRGGFRSGYRGSSYRSGSSVRWKTAVAAGTIYYGSRRYLTRRRYYNNQAPAICENNNRKTENGTPYGKFVCPLGEQPDDYDYCCGESGNQRCCRFADDPGRVAGLVVGLLLGFIVIAVSIFCFCKYCKSKKKSEGVVLPSNQFSMKPAAPPYSTYPNGTAPNGTSPNVMTHNGYPQPGVPDYSTSYPASEPPAYDKLGGMPYSPNPTGAQNGAPPVGFVEPNGPNYGFTDPSAKGQGYSDAPTRY